MTVALQQGRIPPRINTLLSQVLNSSFSSARPPTLQNCNNLLTIQTIEICSEEGNIRVLIHSSRSWRDTANWIQTVMTVEALHGQVI